MIRVFLADDHTILREGLRRIFDETPDIKVVGEAADGATVLRLARDHDWDVLILDLGLPGINGVDVLSQLQFSHHELPVLVLSMNPEDQYAVQVIKAGAAGYLSKGCPPEQLLRAVRSIAGGGRYVSEKLAAHLARSLQVGDFAEPHDLLTQREMQVLRALAAGKTQSQAARELNLSAKTVNTHKARILEKLNMTSMPELLDFARKTGMLNQPVDA